MTLSIQAIPAFTDNYFWLLHNGGEALVVDPGAAAPVQAQLRRWALTLRAILLTHHHGDHIGGVRGLCVQRPLPVYGPQTIACVTHPLAGGDRVTLDFLDTRFDVRAVPGHTLDHIAYTGHSLCFCGDTIFAAGCGRLFEGTPAQMWQSLQQLAALPLNTQIFCAHEYTLNNLRFALSLTPDDTAVQSRHAQAQQLRAENVPTVPSTLAEELLTNPFLRCVDAVYRAVLRSRRIIDNDDPLAAFTTLRRMKDRFQ